VLRLSYVKVFDQKFGATYFASLPTTPAVYKIYNGKGEIIYVGKAKNLRRRLGQYRNAKRRKKHAKMRKIVGEAASIQYELYPSDHAACLAEIKVIQEERPKFNRAGAFSFMYPLVGLAYEDRELTLLYTTEPEKMDPALTNRLSMHGAYRSRHLSGNAFFALVELLTYVGHQNKPKKIGKYSYLYSFRQIDPCWPADLESFFRGDSADLLENLILALVERSSTRRKAAEIQDLFNDLKRFLRFEAKGLARMRKALGAGYPVSQRQRDVMLLEYQHQRSLKRNAAPAMHAEQL
jgi:predicted GIY-YIG superfamily endonuclease